MKIFVGGIGIGTTEDDVKKYFEQFGKVLHNMRELQKIKALFAIKRFSLINNHSTINYPPFLNVKKFGSLSGKLKLLFRIIFM